MMKKIIQFIAIYCIISNLNLFGQENIWFSNTPPLQAIEKVKTTGMRRLPVVYGKRRQVNIIQWIRSGKLPENSKYIMQNDLKNPELFVFDPDGLDVNGKLAENELGFVVSFPGRKDGFYSIYLVEKFVKNDTLNIRVAKTERMHHSCREGHDKALVRVQPKTYPEHIPIEIVRERSRGENLHTVMQPGNEVIFKTLINEIPYENGTVQMVTHRGWINSKTTDVSGEVVFQFIQDDNTKIKELRSRITFNYLIHFQKTIAEIGIYNDVKYNFINYSSTFSDTYRPSQMLYSSFVWALFVVLGSVILLVTGIYFYRKRLRVDYKEVALK
ncbi:MAG: hypothetical protein GY936_12220 [Ignavibacteriae bacterium]|nr:hypothetical protein [Ignavibacteriota bacterium]